MTRTRIAELLYATLNELRQGFKGEAKAQVLFQSVEKKLSLTEEELSSSPSSTIPRWKTNVQFYSIDCTKAGYLVKKGGSWALTEEGKSALASQDAESFLNDVGEKYRAWAKGKGPADPVIDVAGTVKADREVNFEEAKDLARNGIERYLDSLEGWEFQNIVAELLTGIGYVVRYNSSTKGADGGIDIVAYNDSFGFQRVIVEVKHRKGKATAKDIAYLQSNIGSGAIGLFISTGGFTQDAINKAEKSPQHIETMDLDGFLLAWQTHFTAISRKGQEMLPLVPVYFLEPKIEQ